MTIAGNLRTMGFPDLVQWLSTNRKTGTLVVDGLRFTKKIIFRTGQVVAVSSDNPREMLGYYLCGWRYLTEDELHYLIEMQHHFKVMLGELAVKMGHLPPDDLDRILLLKTEETIYELMEWDEGNFRFLEGDLPDREFAEVDLPVHRFLLEGFRQRDERKRMREAIPDTRSIPILVAHPDETFSPHPAILEALDGERSVERIALCCQLPAFDVMRVMYAAIQAGCVRLDPPTFVSRLVPGASDAPWLDVVRDAEDAITRNRLLDALDFLSAMREKYGDFPEAEDLVERTRQRVQQAIEAGPLGTTMILEPTAALDELLQLDCAPAEGFVLSRINGMYSVEEVLRQLPGTDLYNWAILHNLLRRGLVKVRDARTVRRYRKTDGQS